jgi:protein-disulfide isomerase
MAVKAAMGLIACSAVKEIVKKTITVMEKTKITAAPTANFFRLNFSSQPPINVYS